jgi:murein DD-endopeptidase
MRLTTLAVLSLLVSPLAAQRAPLVSTVDMVVPAAPAVVRIDGRAVVVHELHLTNFQAASVAISRVQVLAAPGGATIGDYAADELIKRVGRPGLLRPLAAADVLGAGMRAVVYFWIELPEGATPPPALQHRVELELRRPSGAVRTVVSSAEVTVSPAAPLVLDPPVRGGPWTAIYDPLLMGGHRTAIYTLDGRARIPSRFAIDWIRLPATAAASVPRRRPSDWNGYGDEILAVADAIVAQAMDDVPENADPPVPAAAPMAPEVASGNYVALDLGGGRWAFYEHLRRGSLAVKVGDRVTRGQVIARLGNSGSSSIGPHLHFHVADANATLGAEGLPFVFREFEVLGVFPSIQAVSAGDWQRRPQPARRTLEHPAANTVLRFR